MEKKMMTTVDLFAEEVVKMLEKELGDDNEISVQKVTKNNGLVLTGITVREKNCNIAPTIYVDRMFSDYENGRTLESICSNLLYTYHAHKKERNFNMDVIKDYESVKDNVCFKLINAKKNEKMLAYTPHITFEDLAVVFYVPVMDMKDAMGSIMVKNNMIEIWQVDTQTLYKQAMKNTARIFASNISTMAEVLKESLRNSGCCEMFDDEMDLEDEGVVPMYVCTNVNKVNGAGVFLYDGLLRDFADRLDKDLYILPSSVHETLFVPASTEVDAKALTEIVREVNETMVEPEDILSDNVYYYSRKDDTVTMIKSA